MGPRPVWQVLLQIHHLARAVTVGTTWADAPRGGRGLSVLVCGSSTPSLAEVREMQKGVFSAES